MPTLKYESFVTFQLKNLKFINKIFEIEDLQTNKKTESFKTIVLYFNKHVKLKRVESEIFIKSYLSSFKLLLKNIR
jgi:hypothetical protein